ncbi:hypothetical protein SPFL3102_03045 [Sporomusaceae bacterium FL31]|nr:hypothetical protein SPFL3101_00999 [Sporomusaceae bacterium FL31]GCE35209.1 hypothetical protein SPFL3102_03045 [Sporomusaceae bacterium]
MTDEEISKYLVKNIEILEKIAVNTNTQLRFIYRQEMRGLRRIIQERECLIGELTIVAELLSNQTEWENKAQFQPLLQTIRDKQKQILNLSRDGLEAAMTERNKLKAKLQRFRVMRNVQNRYVNVWMPPFGSRINAKG